MLKKLFLIIFTLYNFSVVAQSSEIVHFEVLTHDFGTVQEDDGPVVYEFRFKNTGQQPVLITDVKASCGCTTPGWTKDPVAPGEEGFIQAQYNTYNRPGFFNKSLTIYTDRQGETAKLYIKGNVVPKPKSPEEELTAAQGNLRMKHRTFNMGKLYTNGESVTKAFKIYNAGPEEMIFKEILKPQHITVALPDTLMPGQSGVMEVSYDVMKKKELGFFSENITLVTNESPDSIKSITLFSNIEEYFPPMSREDFEKAPRISIGEQVYDFNKVKAGEIVTTTYELFNNGLSTLNIRKLDPNCTCVKASLEKNNLAPGESTVIEVAFDTFNRRGNQQKAITIYSNDPSSPVQRLTIKGYVDGDK
jgi:hypothetical protein